jgi:hypothetical protein
MSDATPQPEGNDRAAQVRRSKALLLDVAEKMLRDGKRADGAALTGADLSACRLILEQAEADAQHDPEAIAGRVADWTRDLDLDLDDFPAAQPDGASDE